MTARRTANLRPKSSRVPSRRRQKNIWLLVGGVSAFIVLVVALIGWDFLRSTSGEPKRRVSQNEPRLRRGAPVSDTGKSGHSNSADVAAHSLIEDDGETLWQSPTSGQPIDLAYLPPGVQIIIAMRPQAIASHPEGEKVFASLGPLGQRALQFFNDVLGNPASVDRCVVGCQASRDGAWHTTLVVQLGGGAAAAEHAAKLPGAETRKHNDATYWLANDWAYYAPEGDARRLVVASQEVLNEIIDLDGSPPPLRRDMERLVDDTDADRHFTAVVAPNFLFSEGEEMFLDTLALFRSPLFWFLGDELSAAGFSVHWGESFFIELVATPTLDTSPEATARILRQRVSQIPERIENHVVGLDATPYSRRVIARFPAMVRTLAAHTRAGFDKNRAVLRCYLPSVAGHNLLLGAELTLAESLETSSASNLASQPQAAEPAPAQSVRERLRQTASLFFTRDTLEAAIGQLAEQTGVTMEIVGADLQLEGITKNQSFGIDARNRPAEEILVEILRLANPDKTATGPQDPRQKLVYVIAPASGGQPERILITTRSRAAERGDELPAVFQPK